MKSKKDVEEPGLLTIHVQQAQRRVKEQSVVFNIIKTT